MAQPFIFVSRLLPDPVMAAISDRFLLCQTPTAGPPSREMLLAGFKQADAAICTLTERIDDGIFDAAARLKVLANYAVGVNNIDLEAARHRGIVVTNTPDILTETTADLAWALLLAVARRIPEGHELVQRGSWRGWEPRQLLGADISGKSLGIIGMGRIGQAVARRALGFGMPVLYYSRRAASHQESWRAASFREVLEGSDFVSLHVPLTPETHHLIGREELWHMRRSAFLINTSRGPVVDEAALVHALRENQLAGAALDVYEHEPELHPGLRELRQVVTLPHLGSATWSTRIRMGMVCLQNILEVFAGRTAPNRVV